MKLGTRSVLFGYHQFILHPLFVAAAWTKLYDFPVDPRLWCAFFLHDIGYIGKPNMDGIEGQQHPFLGAHIMHFLFDGTESEANWSGDAVKYRSALWHHFVLYHSRSLAKLYFAPTSPLNLADKLAFLFYPRWLLRLLYWMSGEYKEYFAHKYGEGPDAPPYSGFAEWYHDAYISNVTSLRAEGFAHNGDKIQGGK